MQFFFIYMHVQLTDHSATVHSYYLIGNVINVPEIREQVYVLCFNQTRHAPTYLYTMHLLDCM